MTKGKSKIQYYHLDTSFMPRVREVVKQLEGTPFDVESVTAGLQQKHKEYERKPIKDLKKMVEKALSTIIRKDEDMIMTVDNEEFADRVEQKYREDGAYEPHPGSDDETTKPKKNAMNMMLTARYKTATTTDGKDKTSEVVDLSDDVAAGKSTPATPTSAPAYTAVKTTPIPSEKPNGAQVTTKAKPAAQSKTTPAASKNSSAATTPVSKRQRELSTGATPSPSAAQPPKKLRSSNAGLIPGMNSGGDGQTGEVERQYTIPTATFADVGGIEPILQDIREHIEYPLLHPEIYQHIGVNPPRGILLCGPPGSGKTLMANAIAGELQVPFLSISAPEVVSGMSGESESKIRGLFNDAMMMAPAILFIDEIDAITPKRENAQREMEKRIVAQLLTCMDSLENNPMGTVIIIGATNRPDALDSALRRAGRFDKEITLGVPDKAARSRILQVLSRKMRLAGDFDFDEIAQKTPGFVGADLSALTKEAAVLTINRIFHAMEEKKLLEDAKVETKSEESTDKVAGADPMNVDLKSPTSVATDELAKRSKASAHLRSFSKPLDQQQLAPLCVTMDDFIQAVKKVQPSAKREGFATIPNVSWSDVGALKSIRTELELSILQPIKNPMRYQKMGLNPSAGVCLYGPPGCGKTLLAKAIAFECQANFISIKGPELLNKYVGESERAVRQVFQRAAASSPCVVFFDELDALAPRRSSDESNEASKRVVNQLLTEMDGLDRRNEIFVIAATNRPDMIDPAMIRPGRLDKCLYVPLPEKDDRVDILKTLTQRTPLAADIDLTVIAHDPRCEGFSGADLSHLVKEAAICALSIAPMDDVDIRVGRDHFEVALSKVSPSVSKKDARLYQLMRRTLPGPLSQSVAKIEETVGKDNSNNNNSKSEPGDSNGSVIY